MKNIQEVLVLKVGTSTLVSEDSNTLDTASFERIGKQLDRVRAAGRGVILVSSAARKRLPSVGWQRIVQLWDNATATTTENFLLADHELDTAGGCARLLHAALAGRLAIVNAHDDVLVEGSPYVSNDLVGAAIARHVAGAGLAVELGMLSDVPGVLADINDHSSVIPTIHNLEAYRHLAGTTASSGAAGGMTTKFDAAQLVASAGAETWIAHGRVENAVELAMTGQIGTRFSCLG